MEDLAPWNKVAKQFLKTMYAGTAILDQNCKKGTDKDDWDEMSHYKYFDYF